MITSEQIQEATNKLINMIIEADSENYELLDRYAVNPDTLFRQAMESDYYDDDDIETLTDCILKDNTDFDEYSDRPVYITLNSDDYIYHSGNFYETSVIDEVISMVTIEVERLFNVRI